MSKPILHSQAPLFSTQRVCPTTFEVVPYSLSSDLGSWVVLYFYPKDMTPGCSTQACDLRDHWSEVGQLAKVYGISPDAPAKHQKFMTKYELPFPLLSDESLAITQAYGLWVEKKLYGKTYMGVERSTFIIDPQGKVAAIFEKVKPAQHSAMLVETLQKLQQEQA